MTSSQTEELLRKLDEQHQAYIKTFRLLHETLVHSGQNAQPSTSSPTNGMTIPIPSHHITLSPPLSSPSRAPSRRRRRSTDLDLDRPLRRPATFHSSVFTGDSDESDIDGDLYVQQPLPSYSFDLEDLRHHLKTYKFEEAGEILLKSVVKNGRLKYPGLFRDYPKEEKWHNSHYSVFDIDKDGSPLSRWEVVKQGTTSIDSAISQVIQDLNVNPEARTASGRITIVREPSPLILSALHLTMNRSFNMDEIFGHLVDEKRSNAHMTNRAFKNDERQQRSFVFNFDYWTIVGEEAQPMPWQRTDKPEKQKKQFENHVQLSRCTSVVALSLSRGHVKKLRNAARRTQMKHGFVYDPWALWQVLNIQCYPDHKHSMDSHDSTKHYVNGPEAFLYTLLAELKDAEKRFRDINSRITNLVTPEPDFMFSGTLRDKLLFEDHSFTYSRRYFWAYQTLGIMMNSIKDILDACSSAFTPEFWDGKHRSLFPMLEEDSSRNVYWRKRMMGLKRDFERQLKALNVVYEENDDRRKEIRTLRDQLFSGTSVLESRKSVELSEVTILQGHNIKLLTLVSIFFLPLTFVTSVFGMSNMPQEEQFGVFGIVMATVCIPFFLLIGSLNTTQGMAFWRKKYLDVVAWVLDKHGWARKHVDAGGSDDEDTGSNNSPVRLKTHKRSLSTNLAIQKRQEQTKPLDSAPMPSPPPLATLSSRTNSQFRMKVEDENDKRGRKKTATSSDHNRPSDMTIVEVIPDSIVSVEKRKFVIPTDSEVQTARATPPVSRDGMDEVEAGWWHRIVGKRRKRSGEGRSDLAV